MGGLLEVNEGNGRISFHSLLSFLPSRMKLPFPSLTIYSFFATYSLWNFVLFPLDSRGIGAIGLIIGQKRSALEHLPLFSSGILLLFDLR